MKYQLLETRFDLRCGLVVDHQKSVYSSSNSAATAFEAVKDAHEAGRAEQRDWRKQRLSFSTGLSNNAAPFPA